MPAALLAAEVVIHASTQAEAFGRSVIEAQAMARPVIAADLGGPRRRCGMARPAGWSLPAMPPALAAALREVLALPEAERRRIGAAARLGVPAMAAMQDATLATYRELL
jgi:glycosyltransferase involved in cell wall biosynthesis